MHRRRDLPALDLLKAFEAAARQLSFTKAAAELFLSQSAVSRQIQQLEAQLGVRLFVRRTRALQLTEAGQRYMRAVGQALDQLREATASLGAAAQSTTVTVTTTVTFASLWLVPRLADFQERHPEVAVHVAADNAIRDLDGERLDVSIRYAPPRLTGGGAVRLFGERVMPVCSSRLLARRTLRSPADLGDFVLLHYADSEQSTPWLAWDVWFEVMKVKHIVPRRGLHFSHYDQLIRAAIDGQGVALGRLPLIARLLDGGTLVAPFAEARYSTNSEDRAYWLLTARAAQSRPEVEKFVRWLNEQAAQMAGDAARTAEPTVERGAAAH